MSWGATLSGVLCLLLCAEKLLGVRLNAGLFCLVLLVCDDSLLEALLEALAEGLEDVDFAADGSDVTGALC